MTTVTIKRTVAIAVWSCLPVTVKGALYRRHRAKLTSQLAAGVRRSAIKSFI